MSIRRNPPAGAIRRASVDAAPLAEGDSARKTNDAEGELDPEVVAKLLRASKRPMIVVGGVEEACRLLGLTKLQ